MGPRDEIQRSSKYQWPLGTQIRLALSYAQHVLSISAAFHVCKITGEMLFY